jgi:O-glycosyl hydrolase
LEDWIAATDKFSFTDPEGDLQDWCNNLTKLGIGTTAENATLAVINNKTRDLTAFYVVLRAGDPNVYFRIDVKDLPASPNWWGYGGLNAAVFTITFDTDQVPNSGHVDIGTACDTYTPPEANHERLFQIGATSSLYGWLQIPGNPTIWPQNTSQAYSYWPIIDDTNPANHTFNEGAPIPYNKPLSKNGTCRIAENRTYNFIEFSIPKADFSPSWIGDNVPVWGNTTLHITVSTWKPGEYTTWMHAFDPQAPGTPGETWGTPGGAVCGGSDLADAMPGGKDGIAIQVPGLDSGYIGRITNYMEISPLETNSATVTVNGSIKYQTIDGFGGSGAYYEGWLKSMTDPARSQVVNLLFSDLGTSIYRLRAWTKIERTNDNSDPDNFNWTAFDFSTTGPYADAQVWTAQQARDKGITKFIASVWSPPGWMKDNNQETNGGHLRTDMYEEFAEWLAAYVIGYKNYHNITIGWISIQNEPNFKTPDWETCEYTPEEMRDVIKVVGAKFEAEGITTKIVVPETTGSSNAPSYLSTIMSDPEAAQYVDVFANHLYEDHIATFFNPDPRIPYLTQVAGYGTLYNRSIWQTEYCCGDSEAGTFKEALYTAHNIHNVLTYGNGSAYLVWGLFWDDSGPGQGLIIIPNYGASSYTVTPKFYAAKQYFKFISPGSKRIGVISNNASILVSAYMDAAHGNVTIVAINKVQNSIGTTFNLMNVSVTSFKQYRTSASENCAYIGSIAVSNNSFNVTLPAESITTFTGKISSSFTPVFQKGMSYTSWSADAYGTSASNQSLFNMRQTNTEWVAIMPWWFQDTIYSTTIYPKSGSGWTSPTDSSIIKAISRAHELGMKVMLKPMVDPLDGHWRGEIPPSTAWFQSYADFINHYAQLAEQNGVELFCVGCEYNSNDGATSSWRDIVAGVRERYSGPITYAANHDHYRNVQWWDALDYVGIDAYFSLTNEYDPTVEELKQAWIPHVNTMESWQADIKKPIIFTEIGYRSGNGTNIRPWDWQSSMGLDLQEQVDCYNATFQTFWNKSWFYGFYWWNWETNPNAGGSSDTGFTPQNKPVQSLITSWYAESQEPPHGPTANFTYSPLEPLNGTAVVFNASASLPGWKTVPQPIVNYTWDFGDNTPKITETDPIATHIFAVNGTYTVTLNVTDAQGLWNTTSKQVNVTYTTGIHGISIMSITAPTIAFTSWANPILINVTIRNNGTFQETFNVTVYTNSTSVGYSQTVNNLDPWASITLTFIWDISGIYVPSVRETGTPYPGPPKFLISANISSAVLGEIQALGGYVEVRHPGDTDADGKCYTLDFSKLVLAYREGTKPEKPFNSPQCDFDGDKKVYTLDFSILSQNYRWGVTWP